MTIVFNVNIYTLVDYRGCDFLLGGKLMFIVLLRFSDNKDQASQHMAGHNAWLKRGFDDGVFLLAGKIEPGTGGAVVAQASSLSVLQDRVNEDPFVVEKVVSAEIIEVSPARVDDRLSFLMS